MIIAFISTHEYIKVKDDCQQEKIVIIICFVMILYKRLFSDKKSFYRVIHSKSFEGNLLFNNREESFFWFSACSGLLRAVHKV